jgi:hypothetical protein
LTILFFICGFSFLENIITFASYCLAFPFSTLFNTLAVIALLFIIRELIKQVAGKIAAFSAVIYIFPFTAILNRARLAPKRLFHIYTSGAIHFFSVTAFTT